MIGYLNGYLHGLHGVYCVAPILRLLLAGSTGKERSWFSEVYRETIVPLYFTNFLSEFEKPIRQITTYAGTVDVRDTEFCLKQLLTHWPCTNPRKEVSFLQQFTLLFGVCREEALPPLCMAALRRLATCIASPNSAVALSACFLLLDGRFLYHFACVREKFTAIMIPELRIAVVHWNRDLGEMAASLLETLGDDRKEKAQTRKKDEHARIIWNQLSRQVRIALAPVQQ
jgi:hypothetical protein